MEEVIDQLEKVLKDGDIIVLGCSGGPDSMLLLSLLLNYRKKHNISIICAHVNHNVRHESKDEYLFLENYCEKNKVLFEGMTIEKYSDDNFHNEARNIRYSFFEDLVKKYHANYLCTAHHGDDLIETILMRIVRGSTISGYSGFSMLVDHENYKIFRPFIYLTKDDILKYDKDHSIPYVEDSSNSSSKYTRNRYRKEVLPFLKKEDKNVHRKFLKFSQTLQVYDDYLKKQTAKVFSSVYKDNVLKITKFLSLDDIFKERVILSILEDLYHDDLILICDKHVDLIKNLIKSRRVNTYIYLPNDIKVIKCYDELIFSKEVDLIDQYEIEISNLGQFIQLPNNKCIEFIDNTELNGNDICRLESSDLSFPLRVRTRKIGDKIVLKGLGGSKKIKDIFIDEKIPLRQRDLWPVVVDSKDQIVWLPGLKKSKFDIPKSKKCDIILWYH